MKVALDIDEQDTYIHKADNVLCDNSQQDGKCEGAAKPEEVHQQLCVVVDLSQHTHACIDVTISISTWLAWSRYDYKSSAHESSGCLIQCKFLVLGKMLRKAEIASMAASKLLGFGACA